jgi:isopentenyl phosphate kinase
MCITQDEIRKIVHEELDNKLIGFMEKVDQSINQRLAHQQPSPETISRINALNAQYSAQALLLGNMDKKIDAILQYRDDNKDAMKAVNTILNGSTLIKWLAQLVGWTLIIIGGMTAFKTWILK